MVTGTLKVPAPHNEPVLGYLPGSGQRQTLKARLSEMLATEVEIPLSIGGKAVRTGSCAPVVCPHDHNHVLGQAHLGTAADVEQAIAAAKAAAPAWAAMDVSSRAAIFLRAAELLAGPHRATLNASTMLGQSKTAHQAEIDAACEMIDFFRFNVQFAEEIYATQPISSPGVWNYVDYRPLEGFVFAVTPFNFTSIGGNLPTAPALMGNTVVWKPAATARLSAYYLIELLHEAGLPPGVINVVMGSSSEIGKVALAHPELAGVHFTGSTSVFQWMWQQIGANIERYRSYPRIVGETGGKDFIVAHPSADPDSLATAVIRGAFEYQGQKCSAPSRLYVAESLYRKCRDRMVEETRQIKMGDPTDFSNFIAAIIDRSAYDGIKHYIDVAKKANDATIVAGGECDDQKGFFIRPTIIETTDPKFTTMQEEIFGPVMTVYVYPDDTYADALTLCDQTSPYALTGAIFATDRRAIVQAMDTLRHAAGNFYINDKPTGAVVGQQPFGGARASGTNDKAGSRLNLERWVSHRTVKETFVPPTDYRYPFMEDV